MTILRLSEFLYGEQIRSSVFEPLLADRRQELAAHHSIALRLRWWGAIAATIVTCAPRATLGRLSLRFAIDLAGRALAFFMLAFALQWIFGARMGPHSGTRAWPPSFATTFFFMITPVVWRLRREAIPVHQQRLLTFVFSTACITAAWISAAPGVTMAAAMLLGAAWLTFSSWRMFTAITRDQMPIGPWLAGIYPACAIMVASVPVKLALGISLWHPWWPGDNTIAYLVGAFIGFSARDLYQGEAPYRKFLS